jgi:hypothetical protein
LLPGTGESVLVRIVLIILGVLLSFAGVACGASGLAAFRSLDGDGFVNGGGRMTTPSAAFVTDTAEVDAVATSASGEGSPTLRVVAQRADGGPVFIAIASDEAVEQFLQQGSFETFRALRFGPFRYESVVAANANPLKPPEAGLFPLSASGPGEQSLVWPVEAGHWRLLIMNADGSPGVDVNVSFGVRFPYLRGFAIAGMLIGAILLVAGLTLLFFQLRPRRKAPGSLEDVRPSS